MAKIKLYTEEQVFKMLNRARIRNHRDEELFSNDYLLSNETPIELPSYDEVCDKAEEIAHNYFDMHNTNHYQGLEEGAKRMAKWIFEQIKEQAE